MLRAVDVPTNLLHCLVFLVVIVVFIVFSLKPLDELCGLCRAEEERLAPEEERLAPEEGNGLASLQAPLPNDLPSSTLTLSR